MAVGGRPPQPAETFDGIMAPQTKILIVDDDADLRHTLVGQLDLREEFDTAEADNGAEAIARITREHFDLVLLDIGLPDMDGRQVCRLLRRKRIQVPVI